MMRSKLRLLIFLLAGPGTIYAQLDPLYNQYLFNQSMINPAYTGINDVFNATAISRAQWVGIDGAPVTHALNMSSSILNNRVGLGLLVVSDSYGVNTNTEVQIMYSYRLKTSNGSNLSFGVQTGYISYAFDFDKLNKEQEDMVLTMANDNVSNPNFGAGIFYQTLNYYIGISVPRILDIQLEDGDDKSTRYRKHYYLSAGYLLDASATVKFKPSILMKIVDGQPASIDLNAHLLLKEVLWVGTTLRNFNVVGLNGQFEVNDQLRLGYSFELPLNSVGGNSFGTHELMASFDINLLKFHNLQRRYF